MPTSASPQDFEVASEADCVAQHEPSSRSTNGDAASWHAIALMSILYVLTVSIFSSLLACKSS